MKLIYSQLQKFLPGLDVAPQKLRDDMTMIGHWTNFYEEIDGEIVFDLDIKVNRGDCLGYHGMAKDLSILYNIPVKLPENYSYPKSNYSLPIKIETKNVTRVMAVKIVHLKNSVSPPWLQKFLKLHGVNSINTLVDLTNYVMFLYGIPSHAFDTSKSTDNLIWQMNPSYSKFTSLDNSVLPIDKNILMINNPHFALSLSFWGGTACAIEESTTNSIIEVAIYNPTTVRQNSRQLKVSTEAGIRLEKQLDPELIPTALNHLILLIIDNCGGSVGSQVFDYYPSPEITPIIEFDPKKPSIYSGIDIPQDFALDIVNKVGSRKDITQEEDLIEEVVRFYGYDKIPTNQPLKFNNIPDITPKDIFLIDTLKDQLISLGYDEVLSWPLVTTPSDPETVIATQNSINSEAIFLRQNLVQSLRSQLDQYQRLKLPNPQFFEIGKVFSLIDGKYTEHNSLGIYHHDIDTLRRDVAYNVSTNAVFDGNFAEINLDDLVPIDFYSPKVIDNNAIELTSQIITLDANVTLDTTKTPIELIKDYSSLIDKNILWSMEIIDIFKNKYTFRVNYYNCDDKTAKKIHLSTFDLTDKKYQYIDPKSETKLVYYEDMYLTKLTANIIDIKLIENQKYLILDKTIVFPEGGGQPSDVGTISNIKVSDLKFKNGQVLHHVDSNDFEIGDEVNLEINWANRYKYMKIHSAGHLLHEILLDIDPTLEATKGYHHDESYLIYKGNIPIDAIPIIESSFNNTIKKDLEILCDYTDLETLSKDARSVPKNLPLGKKLRRLKIGNYPSMADGGIQVKSTKEIGDIKITKIDYSEELSTIYYQLD